MSIALPSFKVYIVLRPSRDVRSRVNGSFSNTGQRDALWGKSDLPSSTHTCSHTCLAPRLASGAVIDGRDGDAIPSTNKWKRESRHIDWIRFISVHSLVPTGVLGLFLLFGVSPLHFFSTPDRYERFTIERFSANDSKVGFLYVYWKNHEPFAGPGALNWPLIPRNGTSLGHVCTVLPSLR